jgi:hypothetical protein
MIYVCPMHPGIRQEEEGICPECEMKLVPESEFLLTVQNEQMNAGKTSYSRLLIIVGLIFLVTLVLSVKSFLDGSFAWQESVSIFMAGFFLVFSGFKLLDLKGFAEGYSMYDLLAKKVFAYGYIYPFIELFFGLAFLASVFLRPIEAIEVIVMVFSGIGVLQRLRKKTKVQCACLGTVINVPLGTVTLVEDFGMAILGLILLAIA